MQSTTSAAEFGGWRGGPVGWDLVVRGYARARLLRAVPGSQVYWGFSRITVSHSSARGCALRVTAAVARSSSGVVGSGIAGWSVIRAQLRQYCCRSRQRTRRRSHEGINRVLPPIRLPRSAAARLRRSGPRAPFGRQGAHSLATAGGDCGLAVRLALVRTYNSAPLPSRRRSADAAESAEECSAERKKTQGLRNCGVLTDVNA